MATKSEEILQRYRQIERGADARGRVIGVHRLTNSQRVRVLEMTESAAIDVRAMLLVGASVCEVDDTPYPFPKTRGELNSVFDVLDDEGMAMAAELVGRFNGGANEDVLEAGKK